MPKVRLSALNWAHKNALNALKCLKCLKFPQRQNKNIEDSRRFFRKESNI